MNEKELNAVCALIIRRIDELAKMRDSMATEAAREGIDGEIGLMQGIIAKIGEQPQTDAEMNDYYIAIYNRKGEEINVVCPTWYGISTDKMLGICIGLMRGYGRSTAEVRAYEMDGDGNKGKLIRVQH